MARAGLAPRMTGPLTDTRAMEPQSIPEWLDPDDLVTHEEAAERRRRLALLRLELSLGRHLRGWVAKYDPDTGRWTRVDFEPPKAA